MVKGCVFRVLDGVSGQSYQNRGWVFKVRQASRKSLGFPLQHPLAPHTPWGQGVLAHGATTVPLPPPRRMSLCQGLCECGHCPRSVPCLPVKARVFPLGIFDDVCECM